MIKEESDEARALRERKRVLEAVATHVPCFAHGNGCTMLSFTAAETAEVAKINARLEELGTY